MAKPKILVVGSFVMDQIATTEIFPREGQTVLGGTFSKAPGGKGANQAVQMARLGADVTMVGKLGHDSNGEEMIRTCKEAGICTDYILYDEKLPSGCSVIILEEAPGKQTVNRIIVLSGSNMSITPEDVAFLKEQVAQYDLVVLQLEIPMEINELVAQYAYEKGVPVMLNSAPSAPLSDELLSHLTYISPNEHEAYDMVGIKISHSGREVNMEEAKAATEALKAKGVKNVLITLGEAGAVLDTEKDGFYYSPCVEGIMAADPTAAGDSFVGALSVGLCCGWGYEETLRFANHTAGLTVSAMGAMPSLPTLEKVEAFMKEKTGEAPDTSVLR
ncbi:MAG TPA: ribokinase [Candidatus Choladousia intestinigallinarum]|nr:ribokinase [Candidatus Choladousia intestinigallinarum]